MSRHKCLILGASGIVGQRLQQRLVHHPMFEICAVAGSEATAGANLATLPWRLDEPRPELPNLEVLHANDDELAVDCQKMGITIAFSGLPAAVAKDVESRLVTAGIMVFSNASAFRRVTGIPMIIPEVNPNHIIESMHYCATNCTLIPLAIPVAAINQLTKIKSIKMRSEQALSGAGWELLSNPEAITGRVNPHIEGEAEKTKSELLYVNGTLHAGQITPASIPTDIKCRRISRRDGHQVFVEIEVYHEFTLAELHNAVDSMTCLDLPSAPVKAIHLVDKIDPKAHLWSDGVEFTSQPRPATNLKTGMAIIMGDIAISGNRICFSAYSHNTIRGAAGGVVLLAEFILANKF